MDAIKKDQKEILALAEKTKYNCDLLIKQCNSWLSEEEGAKNLKKQRPVKRKRSKIKGFLKKIFDECHCLSLSILLLLAALNVQAQTETLTDLEKELLQVEQEIAEGKTIALERVEQKYLDLIFYFHTRDVEKTHLYFQKAIGYYRLNNCPQCESLVLTQMGSFYSTWGKTDSADIFFTDALKAIEGKEHYREESIIHDYRGSNFAIVNDVKNAMSEFLKALEINEKDKERNVSNKQKYAKNLIQEVDVMLSISGIYYNMSNLDKTKEYLLRSLKIINENRDIDMSGSEISIIGNLSQIYWEAEQYDEAFPLMEKYYEMASNEELLGALVFATQRLADYYRIVNKDLILAQTYANKARDIAEQTQQPYLINLAERSLMSLSLALKDYQTAHRYAESVLSRCKEDDWESLENVYSELVKIYALKGDMDSSAVYQNWHRKVITKMSDKNLHSALQEMEVKYDVQQKEHEIERQQNEISRHRTRQNMFIGGLSLAVLLLVLLVYTVRLRTRRARELAETNATKDKFFSIISHDLKNPAVALRDALQLLSENSGSWDTASLSDYYKKLLKSADGQVDLLYTLLGWAQLQTGRMPYNPVPFDLVAAIKSGVSIIKNMAEDKGLTFTVQTPDIALVTGDYNMLTTVIRNLLTNSVKFTAKGGTVTLEITPIPPASSTSTISPASSISVYTVTITDTGIGITVEQLQNLFRLDHQQSRRGTSGEQGSGLGLIVCKELLEKHGSKLNVKSEAGKGSRFWFTL